MLMGARSVTMCMMIRVVPDTESVTNEGGGSGVGSGGKTPFSIRSKVLYEAGVGGGGMRIHASSLLSELIRRGLVDLVEDHQWGPIGGPVNHTVNLLPT